MVAGTVLLLPLAPATARAVPAAPAGATLAALYLGVLKPAAGFVVWGYAIARLTVTAATAALYLVPVTALVVAYVWLGETPGPVEYLGGAVTLAGVALLHSRPRAGGSGGDRTAARLRCPRPRSPPGRGRGRSTPPPAGPAVPGAPAGGACSATGPGATESERAELVGHPARGRSTIRPSSRFLAMADETYPFCKIFPTQRALAEDLGAAVLGEVFPRDDQRGGWGQESPDARRTACSASSSIRWPSRSRTSAP
ncbi:DMT family transporter [Streptomyces camelliae]|uniref:DMT family transporter n=2 Tax=Streptomyces camelliae TaxID=3004093 RepID=A0ABY7PEW1_9ACTN|nr:DMT family transporter [Streptomyces sp. HUAS 2-6]WBO69170.1 DMT family transporter [Streptomyces sp. HUAS 2-6]